MSSRLGLQREGKTPTTACNGCILVGECASVSRREGKAMVGVLQHSSGEVRSWDAIFWEGAAAGGKESSCSELGMRTHLHREGG